MKAKHVLNLLDNLEMAQLNLESMLKESTPGECMVALRLEGYQEDIFALRNKILNLCKQELDL